MEIYWGYVVCVAFLFHYTLCQGIATFTEFIIPLEEDTKASLTVIGKFPARL